VQGKTKAGIVGAVVLLVAGFGIGQGVQPKVYQPEPRTEVVVKYIDRVEEVEVEVPAELPAVCIEAIDAMHALRLNMESIDTAAGDILLEGAALQSAAVQNDVNGMVLSQEAIRESLSTLDTGTVEKLDLINHIDSSLERCESAIG
jgi:hypothetical protein